MLAEDNPVTRKLMEKTLHKAGYEVTSVENGRKALDLFKEKFFPIVITDWMMPEMDGIELCKELRKNGSDSYVFIVLLTSKDSKDDIVSGLEAGADDYLTKPSNRAELIARIKTGVRILELEGSLKKANEEIRVLSITDYLTRSYNRLYLNERLPQEIVRARRYRHPLSLVLCDIDHFKSVNDTYGHQAGDKVLREFTKCIRETIRENVDLVARYGGEEFIIVAPETDFSGALILAERVRSAVSQMVVKIKGKRIHITASFGVTGFDTDTPTEKISSEAVINQADKYLYQAKREGRNRVRAGKVGDN